MTEEQGATEELEGAVASTAREIGRLAVEAIRALHLSQAHALIVALGEEIAIQHDRGISLSDAFSSDRADEDASWRARLDERRASLAGHTDAVVEGFPDE